MTCHNFIFGDPILGIHGIYDYRWYCPHRPIYKIIPKKLWKSLPTIAISIIALITVITFLKYT